MPFNQNLTFASDVTYDEKSHFFFPLSKSINKAWGSSFPLCCQTFSIYGYWYENDLAGLNSKIAGSLDPTDKSRGGKGENWAGDDETRKISRDAPEHDTKISKGAWKHAEWNGRLIGQNKQDVWHAGQVQGRAEGE